MVAFLAYGIEVEGQADRLGQRHVAGSRRGVRSARFEVTLIVGGAVLVCDEPEITGRHELTSRRLDERLRRESRGQRQRYQPSQVLSLEERLRRARWSIRIPARTDRAKSCGRPPAAWQEHAASHGAGCCWGPALLAVLAW